MEDHTQVEEEFQLARRASRAETSFIREILKLTARNDIISFAGGMPNPKLFPVDAIREATDKVLREDGANVLQYTITEGYMPLKEFISQRYKEKKGLEISPDKILIINGSMQAIDLIGKLLLNPGDNVILENPTFIGALQSFNILEANFVGVNLEEDGLDISHLEAQVASHKSNLSYLIPNFHNPTGITYSEEKRQNIAEIFKSNRIMVIEDDPYGEINFSGALNPSFAEYYPEGTFLMGSFSKIISPGMRLGWVTSPNRKLMEKLVVMKQAADTHASNLSQRIIHQFLCDTDLNQHIDNIKKVYKAQLDAMVEAIEENFPKQVKTSIPEGGMFIWGILPERYSASALFDLSIKEKVAFVPALSFYAHQDVDNTFRLNYSNADEDDIKTGIEKLGRCLKEYLI